MIEGRARAEFVDLLDRGDGLADVLARHKARGHLFERAKARRKILQPFVSRQI
jgi:hypothetical protein